MVIGKVVLAGVTLVLAMVFVLVYDVGRVGLAGGRTRADAGVELRSAGWAALARARATADPAYYLQAEGALTKALAARPGDPDVLVGLGTLALARHRFEEALALGEQARAIAPKRAAVYGVIGDAQVELGRYEEALDTIQTMVDLRPDLASYTRVSYLRELQGDLDGAVRAMRLAVDAAPGAGEPLAWTRVQLGHLLLRKGQVADAEREYRWALAADPNNMAAVAGLGRARVSAGDYAGAIPLYEQAVERYPLPEVVVTLGELYEAVGRSSDASRQLELARALQELVVANGGNVDLELALFEAERGDPSRAVSLARAEVERRPSVHAYDALAWALYHAGRYEEAREASRQALSLGTRDGLMLFHAGMVEIRLGEVAQGRRLLTEALEADPGFSVRWARVAREMVR